MSVHSSSVDEYGTAKTTMTLRKIEDIADDKGSYYLMKDEVQTIIRRTEVTVDKPLYFRAGSRQRWFGNITQLFYTGTGPFFQTFPLKSGDILSYSDSGGGTTIVTTNGDHFLNIDDVFRIIDARVEDYTGNFTVIDVPNSDEIEIDVPFNTVDGQSRFVQSRLFISSMADSVTSPGVKTTLTMVNHGLDDDISITIRFTGPPPPPQTLNIFKVSNVTTDTVDIERVFTSTNTGLADVGFRNLEIFDESIVRAGGPPNVESFIDLEGTSLPAGSLIVDSTVIARFNIGESRGMGAVVVRQGAWLNCAGFVAVDAAAVNMTGVAATVLVPPVTTAQYASCIRIPPYTNRPTTLNINENNLGFREFQNFLEIPQINNPDATFNVLENGTAGAGSTFALGYVARANNTAIVDAGGGTITIFLDDTLRFREGDEIEILESTSYAGQTGTIQVGGIVFNTSITIDIAFVAGDTAILLRDNTLIGLQKEDPQVQSLINGGLADSTVTGNGFLPYDANELLAASATPQPINGTWGSSLLERIEFTPIGGIFTYTGIIMQKLQVSCGATVSGAASSQFFIHILKNGIDVSSAPPVIDIVNAANEIANVGITAIEVDTGDTLQVAISTNAGGTGPTVSTAFLNVSKI